MMRVPRLSHERGPRYFIRSPDTTARQVPYAAASDNADTKLLYIGNMKLYIRCYIRNVLFCLHACLFRLIIAIQRI